MRADTQRRPALTMAERPLQVKVLMMLPCLTLCTFVIESTDHVTEEFLLGSKAFQRELELISDWGTQERLPRHLLMLAVSSATPS